MDVEIRKQEDCTNSLPKIVLKIEILRKSTMALPVPTLNQVFNQMYSGRKWPLLTITFSFPTSPSLFSISDKEAPGFAPLLAAGQDAARLALSLWDDLIIPDLREVSGGNVSTDLEFGLSLSGVNFGHAYFPTLGSVWFNASYGPSSGSNNLTNPNIGQHGFTAYIHEIGHALGLEHSGIYNGTGNWSPLNYHDSTVFSLMSYFGPSWRKGEGDVAWADWVGSDNVVYSPQTPMLNDIYVIQQMYGAETTTRLGDTTYGFNSNITGSSGLIFDFSRNKNPILTIYDSGGIDILDLSGWNSSSLIDLRQGKFSSANSMTNNIAIAYNCDIENAVGGGGDDKIYGNNLNNILKGGGGNDWFNGLGGNDIIYGGTGTDTVYFSSSRSSYQIKSFGSYVTVQIAESITVIYESEYLEFADEKILVSTFSNSSDNSAPTAISFSPSDGATGVAIDSNISVTFSENIARGSGSITLRSGSPSGPIVESFDAATSSRISISGATMIIDPTVNLQNATSYFLVVASGNIKDLAGNFYTGTSSYDFQTVPVDTTAPTVVNFSPADGAIEIASDSNVAVTFSENVSRGSGAITLRSGSATGTVIEAFDVATSTRISITGAKLIIDPTSELPAGTQIFVIFSAGSIKDSAGNSYGGTSAYDFKTSGTAAVDDFPNNTGTTGLVLIDDKEGAKGKIETVGDTDLFKVTLVAGTTYNFLLTATSGALDPQLALYNGDIVKVAYNDDYGSSKDSRIVFTPTSSGTYYLQVADHGLSATGSYKLQAIKPDLTPPRVLSFLPVDGSTAVPVDSNIIVLFSEDIDRGNGLITVRSGSASGAIIESFESASSARLLFIGSRLTIDPTNPLPAGAQIFVTFAAGSVKDLAGNSYEGLSTYDFTTSATTVPDDFPNATTTSGIVDIDGKAAEGNIETKGDLDLFKVNLVAGTKYTFSLDAVSGSIDPYLRLYSSDIILLLANDDYSEDTVNSVINFTPTSSGTYYLQASDYTGTATGTYRLSGRLSTSAADDFPNSSDTKGLVLIDGNPSQGKIETPGDADVFKVTLVAGTAYTFSMTAASGSLDPYLTLYSSDLVRLAYNDNANQNTLTATLNFTATYSGTYYLQAFAHNTTGAYSISGKVGSAIVDDFPNSTGTTGVVTTDGKESEGKIEIPGDIDLFKVNLTSGTTYTFFLNTVSGSLDTYLNIYDSNIKRVAYNDDVSDTNSNSKIVLTAIYTGVYYLQVSDFQDKMTGSYKISAIANSNNRAPVFSSTTQAIVTNEDTSKSISLDATDADNDKLIYSTSTASNGTTVITGATVTYTPKLNFNGTDSFIVTASDGKGGTATQTINVTVTAVNDAPTFSSGSQSVSANAGAAKTITLAATDVDRDALTYITTTPSKGSATISGSTLTYTPTSSATGTDSFTVTASDGKGGTATQTISVTISAATTTATQTFRLVAPDGWVGSVGGNGNVVGTSGFQDVRITSGSVSLDGSFNTGNDIVRLDGNGNGYSIVRSGSSATISKGSSASLTVPIGTTGAPIVFDDGPRKLVFSNSNFNFGSQTFSTTQSAITAGSDGTALPTGASASAVATAILAGTSLSSGQTSHISIAGTAKIVGTSVNEVVQVISSAKSNLTFDPSFNQGGDVIVLGRDAGSFTAQRSSSSMLLVGPNENLTIPIGTAGLTLRFTDGDRTLIFSNGEFKIGTQSIGTTAIQLTGSTTTTSIDVGTAASPVTLNASTGAVNFTDNAAVETNVRITGFGANDRITVTGATSSRYSFTTVNTDGNSTADLVITFNNVSASAVNSITLVEAVSANAFVADYATAQAAIGNAGFMVFG